MTDQEAPKIEYPCPDYKIMVVGNAADDYVDFVVKTISEYDPLFDPSRIVVKPSKNNRFTSVRALITATSEDQLDQLHKSLKASGRVHMVL